MRASPKALHPPAPDHASSSGAFTLIELLAVIAIIAILAALIMPAMEAVRKKSLDAKSVANLRQIAVCANLFSADNNGSFLPGKYKDASGNYQQWQVAVAAKASSSTLAGIWDLPKDNTSDPVILKKEYDCVANPLLPIPRNAYWQTGYGINMDIGLPDDTKPNTEESWGHLYNSLTVSALARRPFIYEWPVWNAFSTFTSDDFTKALQGRDQLNILFCDGHVGSVKKSDENTFRTMLKNPSSM